MGYKCFFCKNIIEPRYTSRTSNSKTHNAVFLAAFKIATSATEEFLANCFANIRGRKFICCGHYISAAQYIIAEIIASGGKVSVTKENVSYIDNGAIPAQILADLNDAMTFTDGITVSGADVARYLNVYVKKYYVHGCWSLPQADEKRSEDAEDKLDEEPSSSGCLTQSMECQPPDDMRIAEPRNSEFLAEELLGTSNKHEDSGSDETVNGLHSGGLRLEETNSALLDRFFVVKGRKLLELFHLNGCGCEYNTETGTVCLKKHPSGDVPIVEFIVQGHETEVRQWTGL